MENVEGDDEMCTPLRDSIAPAEETIGAQRDAELN